MVVWRQIGFLRRLGNSCCNQGPRPYKSRLLPVFPRVRDHRRWKAVSGLPEIVRQLLKNSANSAVDSPRVYDKPQIPIHFICEVLMSGSRRQMLTLFAGATGLLIARPLFLSASPQVAPVPSPHAPNPNFPPGLDGPPLSQDKQPIKPNNQKAIRDDVEQLYQLASGLKNQVEKPDFGSTLSVSFVKQSKQIEKLAKKIRQLSQV